MMRRDWAEVPYESIVNNVSTSKKRVRQKDYLSQGKYPIIDQGQETIGGYTNDDTKLLDCSLPAIVFGDHTKIVKLIKFKFVPGADGIKVLEPKSIVDPKYLTYFTKVLALKIKDKGYARHYQYIKKQDLPISPLPEQRAIVSKIEQLFSELDNGIDNLKAAKKKLEMYRQAVLKKAFEGELTKEWRKKQADLPSARRLLEGIADEWRKFQKSQLHEWKQAIEEWERNGRQGRKPSKPGIDTGINCVSSKVSTQKKGKDFWITTTLGQLGMIICGQSPKISDVNTRGEGILYITGPEQWDGKKIKKNKWTLLPKRIAPDGSIFITVKGAGVGKLFPGTRCAIGRDIYAFRPGPFMNYSYVYYALKHSIDEVIMKAQGDIPGLSKNHIMDHCIGLCSKREQDQIVYEIETRLSVCDNILDSIEKGLKKAEALRQSILKKAFEGKLLSEEELEACRKEPNWEPADKLVERIKKQRNE